MNNSKLLALMILIWGMPVNMIKAVIHENILEYIMKNDNIHSQAELSRNLTHHNLIWGISVK